MCVWWWGGGGGGGGGVVCVDTVSDLFQYLFPFRGKDTNFLLLFFKSVFSDLVGASLIAGFKDKFWCESCLWKEI